MCEWLNQVIQSGCKSPYEQRQCAAALAKVLPLLREKCGDGVGSAVLWRHNVTSQQLNSVLRVHAQRGAGNDTFWVRRLLSMLLRHTHRSTPFGLVAVTTTRTSPRLRLTTEHNELLCDIERGMTEGMLSNENWRHVRRFVCTYPVWDLMHISEIGACDVSDWAQFRMGKPEPMSCVQSVQHFCRVWQARYGVAICTNTKQRQQTLYHKAFPSMLPMHVAAFWGFYFQEPCVGFVTRLHHHLDQRHLKGTHRSQIVEAIKTFCLDLCAGRSLRGKNWDTEVQPTITPDDIRTWVTKQTQMRYTSGGRLPTVVVRHIVAMNHFGSLIFGGTSEPVVSRTSMWRCASASVRGSLQIIKQKKTYSHSEVNRLLLACRCHRDRLLLLILTRVGLRSTALRTLQICHMSLGHEGRALEKGQRWHHFFIDAEVRSCMEAYLTHEHPDRGSQYLFPHHTQHHQAMPASQLRTWLHRLAGECDISGSHVTVHSFRRYVITTLLESKNSMEHVARYVGHASPHTTLQYWVTSPAHLIQQMCVPWLGGECSSSRDVHQVWVPRGLLTEARDMVSTP